MLGVVISDLSSLPGPATVQTMACLRGLSVEAPGGVDEMYHSRKCPVLAWPIDSWELR